MLVLVSFSLSSRWERERKRENCIWLVFSKCVELKIIIKSKYKTIFTRKLDKESQRNTRYTHALSLTHTDTHSLCYVSTPPPCDPLPLLILCEKHMLAGWLAGWLVQDAVTPAERVRLSWRHARGIYSFVKAPTTTATSPPADILSCH